MYRSNFLRKLREKEAAEAKAQQALTATTEGVAEEDDFDVSLAAAPRPDDPKVMTTPFQATRILRCCDVFPDPAAKIELWTKLNVDLTRESVRGTCHLPHGLDTDVKILAFCNDDEAEEMLQAGADIAGISEPLRKINQGWLGFDRCIATPAIMPQVMKVAKILGPRKLMPNPRSGTVVQNLRAAIKEAKGGTFLEYRAEGEGELTATIADARFSDAKLLENMKFFVQTLLRARPRGAGSTAGAGGGTPGATPVKKPVAASPQGRVTTPSTKPLIATPGAGASEKDIYFVEAALMMGGSSGSRVRIDPDTLLPASVGYYR